MKRELALEDADTFARDTLRRIQKILGSDLVVLGAYTALGQAAGGRIRLDIRLQDGSTGETIFSASEAGIEGDLFDLVSRIGGRLRASLGVGALSSAESVGVRASLPSNPEAARLYSEALTKLRLFESLGALELLQRATALEPGFALAHAAIAQAWSSLGYDARAKGEAEQALHLSTNLQREDRLAVEALCWEMAKQWDKAIEVLRTLRTFFPDNIEYGLRLATAQLRSGKREDAHATLHSLHTVRGPAADDPRIDLLEAVLPADHARALGAAREAIGKAKILGARLLLAKARTIEGRALVGLSRSDEAKVSYEDALRIFAEAGDRPDMAQVQFWYSALYKRQGDQVAALKLLRQSLATHRETGNRHYIAGTQNDIAGFLKEQGDLEGARTSFEECVSIFREVGAPGGESVALGNVAGVTRYQGDLGTAKARYEEALAIERKTGNKEGVVWGQSAVAAVLYLQGRLDEAKQLYLDSAALCRETGLPYCGEEDPGGLGEVLKAQGDLAGARETYETLLAFKEGVVAKELTEQVQVALAALSVEEGRAVEAEAPAREAVEYYGKERLTHGEAQACGILARVLLAMGKLPEALVAAKRATDLAAKSGVRETRLAVSMPYARALAGTGRAGEADQLLQQTVLEAKRGGFVGLEFEARLARSEIEMKHGNRAVGHAHLQALERDAAAGGFALIARKASAAKR